MGNFSNFKNNIITVSQANAGTTPEAQVPIYDSIGELPRVGVSNGQEAFVNSNNRYYIYDGSGWFSVVMINRSPTITSVQDSAGGTSPFELSTEGNLTTITITAADSDDRLITYSATPDSNFNSLASLSQDSSVFTITPFGVDSATTTSGTITFTATDGINIASSAAQTFTLSFGWLQTDKIQGSDILAGDVFGRSVSVSGDYMVIGAPERDENGNRSGAAYVFARDGNGNWSQQTKLLPNDIVSDDYFGTGVGIDGDYIAVSAPGHGTAGAAYIFYRSGSTWSQQAKVVPSEGSPSTGISFGGTTAGRASIDLNGEWLIVGAAGNNSAYVYKRSVTNWSEQDRINKSITEFGHAVGHHGTGYAAVGAYKDEAGSTVDAGAVYVYTRSGSTFTERVKLTSSTPSTSAWLGYSVDLDKRPDANRWLIIAGAPRDDESGVFDCGAVYIWDGSGGAFSFRARVVASDYTASARFGHWVELDTANNRFVVGAPYHTEDGIYGGKIYVFTYEFDGNTIYVTEETAFSPDDLQANDVFGYSVSVDGDTVVVGAPDEDDEGSNAGSTYILNNTAVS